MLDIVSAQIAQQKDEPESSVEFDSVHYSHADGTRALIDVSLAIRRGETVAIMGTNGAGKSTLVRHVNGLLKPTRGTVRTLGVDTKTTTAANLSRKVGIVYQNPNNQLFAQSVKAEIEFGLKNFGFPPEAIDRRVQCTVNTFGLSEYLDSSPMELSGGEKKRLCIGLVLAWDPEILILDEPTVGQDSEQKEKLVEIIRMLETQHKTVILVTHDVEFMWPIQPRTILLYEGRIVVDGPAQEVFADSEKTRSANVLLPQLVELSNLLGRKAAYPTDVFEARQLFFTGVF